MSSFPPSDYDPSRPQNPFQAPQSSYQDDPRAAGAPGAPRKVEFGELFGKVFEVAAAKAPLFLFCTVALGMFNALGAVASHYLITPLLEPPIDAGKLATAVLATMAISVPLGVWFFCGLTKLWYDVCTGRRAGVDTLLSGGRWLLPAIGVNLIVGPAVSLGIACCCVPGLFAAAVTGAAMCVVVVENRGVFDSLRRSYDLAVESATPIGLVFLCVILIGVVMIVPLAVAAPSIGKPLADVVISFPQAALAILVLIMNVLIYCITTGTPIVLSAPLEGYESELPRDR